MCQYLTHPPCKIINHLFPPNMETESKRYLLPTHVCPILRFKDGAWFQHLDSVPYPLGDLHAILTFAWAELHTSHFAERALPHHAINCLLIIYHPL